MIVQPVEICIRRLRVSDIFLYRLTAITVMIAFSHLFLFR